MPLDRGGRGRQPDGRARASYCHYPNGKGAFDRMAVPACGRCRHSWQTLNDFKNGPRKPGDPRKVNVNQMIAFAENMTPDRRCAPRPRKLAIGAVDAVDAASSRRGWCRGEVQKGRSSSGARERNRADRYAHHRDA